MASIDDRAAVLVADASRESPRLMPRGTSFVMNGPWRYLGVLGWPRPVAAGRLLGRRLTL
jgi:hypothetical protein